MGEKSDPVKRTRSRKAASSTTDDTVFVPGGDPSISEADALTSDAGADDATFQADAVVAGTTGDSTDDIREEIEETRAQMSGTIDEIQERLSPRRLVNEAKETVRDAAVGKVRNVMESASDSAGGIMDLIRENPVPAALIGIGAAWLFGGQRRQAQDYGSVRDRAERDTGERDVQRGYSGQRYAGRGDGRRGSLGVVDTLKQHPIPAALAGLGAAWWMRDRRQSETYAYSDASRWSNDYSAYSSSNWRGPQGSRSYGVRDSAGEDTAGTVSQLAERTQETVSEFAERTQETVGEYTDRAQTEFDRLLRDNPLALGAFAVAVGAAMGMAIPESQREREMMGDVRNQIVDKAQNLAQGAIDKVQQVTSNQPGAGGEHA